VSEDGGEDRKLYGHEVNNKAILEGGAPAESLPRTAARGSRLNSLGTR
jgi:hypothetical protein